MRVCIIYTLFCLYVCISDGRVQVHRGQRRFPEVLRQDVGQTPGTPEQRQRRRRGQHDLQTQGASANTNVTTSRPPLGPAAQSVVVVQQACGFEYTSKLQRMFQDIGVSKDLNEQFKKHLTNSEPLDCTLARTHRFEPDQTIHTL